MLVPTGKHKGKGKENSKRPPSRGLSETSSDLEVPPPARNGHVHKRRKVERDRDGTDAADEFERSVVDESVSAPPTHKLLAGAKGRGKGKGKQQREMSVESGSAPGAAVKQRRKPGPRKKLDALPPATQELLGVPSASASVAGDQTPIGGSRPASPALTSVSATVYELDDEIPPLKRAKKIDDAAMMKRVRTLEEAQRKVWMNIARRDVAKVGYSDAIFGVLC